MNINGIVSYGSEKCCGCTACHSVCPKHCITMKEDKEGFLYPVVDKSLCIDCEQCIKVCSFHNPYNEEKPIKVYAAYNNTESIRLQSSSGGIFTLMAEKTIKEGGVVFGARFTKDWQVEIVPVEDIEGLAAFRESKYLQARVGESFKQAKDYLRQGRKVLFSGTPCQIAGLKHYLRKDYDNLLTVDFVCHGVPSPKVWAKYLSQVTDAGKKAIKDIKFRDKPNGWKRFNFTLNYNDADKSYTMSSYNGKNHYMRAFLSDLILRPSCYNCQVKCGRSHSDITIADFWGIDQALPQMDDDKGTSLLLIHTAKGKEALNFEGMKYADASYDEALKFNPSIEKCVAPHRNRKDFFEKLDSSDDLLALIDKELKPKPKEQIRIYYHRCKHKIKTILLKAIGGDKEERRESSRNRGAGVVPSYDNFNIKEISFRDKIQGWKQYRMTIKLGK